MTKKTLLLGSTGFLGRALKAELAQMPDVVAPTRAELDVTDKAALRDFILAQQPNTIINAVGVCGASACENHPETAQQLNSGFVQALADTARMVPGCTLVHFSSVEVYGDVKPQHGQAYYNEDCPTNPRSLYARTKLQGDLAIASTVPNYLIFRLSALYDAYRLFAVEERDPILLGAPTAVQYVANTVIRGLARINRRVIKVHSGVYHLSAKGDSDWQSFYREITLQRQEKKSLSASPTPALVTSGPKLSVEKIENAFCLFIPSWQSQLATYLNQSDIAASS